MGAAKNILRRKDRCESLTIGGPIEISNILLRPKGFVNARTLRSVNVLFKRLLRRSVTDSIRFAHSIYDVED